MDDEEEVLLALAEVLGPQFMDYVGGPAHSLSLIRILEKLCQLDESTVRDKVKKYLRPSNPLYLKGYREYQEDFCLPAPQGHRGPRDGDSEATHERRQLPVEVRRHSANPHGLRSPLPAEPARTAHHVHSGVLGRDSLGEEGRCNCS